MTNEPSSESALGLACRIRSGHDSDREVIGTITPVDRVDPVAA